MWQTSCQYLPLERSIPSCPAGQRNDSKQLRPSKTKDLRAQLLESRKFMTEAVNLPEAAVSQLALLHRISGIVSSDMSLQKMLDELIGLVVGVTSCDACLAYLLDSS